MYVPSSSARCKKDLHRISTPFAIYNKEAGPSAPGLVPHLFTSSRRPSMYQPLHPTTTFPTRFKQTAGVSRLRQGRDLIIKADSFLIQSAPGCLFSASFSHHSYSYSCSYSYCCFHPRPSPSGQSLHYSSACIQETKPPRKDCCWYQNTFGQELGQGAALATTQIQGTVATSRSHGRATAIH